MTSWGAKVEKNYKEHKERCPYNQVMIMAHTLLECFEIRNGQRKFLNEKWLHMNKGVALGNIKME